MGSAILGPRDSAQAGEEQMTPDVVVPDTILEIGNGFRAAKLLFAASELGLFEHLAAGPATIHDLAARMEIMPSRLRVLVDALVVLGLVERHDDIHRNGPVAATYLSGQTAADLRPALRFWDRLSYPRWSATVDLFRPGPIEPSRRGTDEEQRIFSEGVEALTAGAARALPTIYDFRRHRRVLDLGGGTGSWLVALRRRHAHLQATLFERPQVAAIARRRLADEPATRDVAVVEGDFTRDPIPAGHDAILVAHVLHGAPAEANVALLRRIRDAAAEGARLLLVDAWTDATRTRPPFALIYAAELLAWGGAAGVYSEDEARAWLREAGWHPIDTLPLPSFQRALVADAVAPH